MKLLKPAVNLMHDDETENKLDRACIGCTDRRRQNLFLKHEKFSNCRSHEM